MYRCISGSEGETWVISAADDADARSRCEGDVQVAPDTAQAHPISGSMDNPPVLQGFRFVGGLEQCAHILHSEDSRRAQIRSYIDADVGAEVVLFADGVEEQDVACTMLWRLGPYAPVRHDGMQTRLVLPHGLGRIELAGDILVRKGESLVIETEEALASAATTAVVVGERQLRVEVDGHFVANQRADGLIIASPTGSTAYAMSAGGPLLHPSVAAWVMVPIAPHTLSNRPIALADSAHIAIEVVAGRDASANFDMQSLASLMHGDRIEVTRSKHKARFLHPLGWTYFDTLRQKMHWNEGVA
jgi:hypothetical protein